MLTINKRESEAEFEIHKGRLLSWREELPQEIKGIIFQEELGEEGTRHLQIYVRFYGTQRVAGVKRIFGVTYLHAEVCRSPSAAVEYCSKEETRIDGPWSIGEVRATQGKRSDLIALKESIGEGLSNSQLWEQHFPVMLRNHQAVGVYRLVRKSAPRTQPRVRVYYGPTGTGKTHRAYEEAKEKGDPFLPTYVGTQASWFDGWNGSDPLILDEFSGQYTVDFIKRLLDKYPFQAPVKGGFLPVTVTDIWITSNYAPELWWMNDKHPPNPRDRAAVMRRVHIIEHMEQEYRADNDDS